MFGQTFLCSTKNIVIHNLSLHIGMRVNMFPNKKGNLIYEKLDKIVSKFLKGKIVNEM